MPLEYRAKLRRDQCAANPTMKGFDNRAQNFRLRGVPDGVLAQLVEHHNGIVGVRVRAS